MSMSKFHPVWSLTLIKFVVVVVNGITQIDLKFVDYLGHREIAKKEP